MQSMQAWVRKYLCGICPAQQVEGRREYAPNQFVDKKMIRARDRRAHVCPFIELSLNADLFWIEESDLSDRKSIEDLLTAQIDRFKADSPAYDPTTTNTPAPDPQQLKTYLTFFPNVRDIGNDTQPSIKDIHLKLKPTFMDNGMMIGESFNTYESHSIYNPKGRFHSLSSPYPALAIRYMVWHDRIFAGQWRNKYERFFP